MSNTTFAHVALNCRDMAATEAFYTRHFGFRRARVVEIGPDNRIIFLKAGEVYLELFCATEKSPYPPPENDGPVWNGVRHIAFEVDDVDDKLAEIGVDAELTLGPLTFDDFIPGWKTAWVRDPEGNIVEISQGFVDQVNPPAAEYELAAEAAGAV